MTNGSVPRILQELSTLQATLPMWQRKLAAVLLRTQGTTLQKVSASDEGFLTLSVYKPGDDRSLVVLSIRKNAANVSLEQTRTPSQAKPNGLVQIMRKYVIGRRIVSAWCTLRPVTVGFDFAPPAQDDPERDERLAGPDTLLLDLDARPARICLAKKHAKVPDRYSNVLRVFRESGLDFFESFCEWSLETTKTKRRATFDEPIVTFSFLPVPSHEESKEPRGNSEPTHSSTKPETQIKPEKTGEITLTGAFSFLPPHVRRAAKTRYQFLERRLSKQKADFPLPAEIERLSKRAQGLQTHLYLWPKGSNTWYVPAEIIAEFSLPAFFKLKPGQKPGDLMEESFHELERIKRRHQELENRIAISEIALSDFASLVMQAAQEISSSLAQISDTDISIPAQVEKQLGNLATKINSVSAERICQICDVAWLQSAEKKSRSEKEKVQRLPWKSYKSFTGEFIRVGKSAQDSDLMLKAMPANHLWLHILTGEGSHVWLERPRGGKPTPRAIRDAAILAIQHSKHSKSMSGEVRIANRSDIERKKKLAPGKVLIRRCETMVCKYTDEELQRILATHNESEIK